QQQLGGDVPALVELGGVDVVVGAEKIGAGILPIVVEEEVVKLVRQIVVMRHVLSRADDRVVLVQSPHDSSHAVYRAPHRGTVHQLVVAGEQLDQRIDVAAFERQRAV